MPTPPRLGFIGFGEAAPAMAAGLAEAGLQDLHAFDIAYPGTADARFEEKAAMSRTTLLASPRELAERSKRELAASGRYDALVALGAVIRGGTPHFDFVCKGVTDGVREVIRDTSVPVAFGVLTTDDVEQALARCSADENKGREAALAAVEMARLQRALRAPHRAFRPPADPGETPPAAPAS